MGRPRKENTMTDSERQAAYLERRIASGERILRVLVPADDVEKVKIYVKRLRDKYRKENA